MSTAETSRVNAGTQQMPGAHDATAKLASVALVPLVAAPQRLAPTSRGLTRPDPTFVTHLIAMAQMSPQTRVLRRAEPQDVQAAYRAVANQNRAVTPPGVRMRQSA
jgi:hypothetical protein